ncbi:MAG: DMT family transporter [Elainellaceae cyanobacterium]
MLGFAIVLLASTFFCFQNVIVRVLFNEYTILGIVQTGGFVAPSLQNSFLLMFMRMVVVVPLMAIVASKLYPPTWSDLQKLGRADHRTLLMQSIGCGILMFLYLALLYLSIGLIPTGIALTLFFTYPAFTALFSWQCFGDRPTLLRWGIMAAVFSGSILTMPYVASASAENSWIGYATGVASGIAYAVYTVIAQKSFETLNPVPFTWISFATTFLLSGVSLLIWTVDVTDLSWNALWIGGLLSAIVTLAGHLIYNFGIRLIGAAKASMIGAANPALTVALAWLTIQETLSGLQIAGVVIVTLSVVLLSQEKRLSKA